MSSSLSLQNNAACKDKDTEMFFVDEGPISDADVRSAIKKAIAICNLCDVQHICLMTAMNNEEEFGIWGGFTSRERRKHIGRNVKITLEEAEDFVIWKRSQ